MAKLVGDRAMHVAAFSQLDPVVIFKGREGSGRSAPWSALPCPLLLDKSKEEGRGPRALELGGPGSQTEQDVQRALAALSTGETQREATRIAGTAASTLTRHLRGDRAQMSHVRLPAARMLRVSERTDDGGLATCHSICEV
jgi:hypothetical protein